MRALEMHQIAEFVKQYRSNWKECIDRKSSHIMSRDFVISAERKRKFGKTSEMMKGFCFMTSTTGFSKPNNRKGDGDDEKGIELS
jgi:hypothetical protein